MNCLLRAAVAIILFLGLTSCSNKPMNMSENTELKIESEVHQAFLGLVEASKALDVDRYFAYFDKMKFTGVNADGTVWRSVKDLEALIVPGFSSVKRIISLEFNNVKITVINQSTAILINEYRQSIELKNGDVVEQAGAGTQVWSKVNGTWKLVSVSDSNKPQITK
ncbi:MAG: nuclear transport factor 2 family protein [Pseudomonadota bacterium]